jgi:hypothetical protein
MAEDEKMWNSRPWLFFSRAGESATRFFTVKPAATFWRLFWLLGRFVTLGRRQRAFSAMFFLYF